MLEAANLITHYVKGTKFEDFVANREKQDAVALRLSILGEAAAGVDKETEAALPEIPFPALRGLRNRIVHDYGSINFHIVWAITQKEIKPLARRLKAHLARCRQR